METIALAGLLAGALDITATSTLMSLQGMPIERLWQGIASGVLGTSAFKGGKKTAALGLFFHFVIAFIIAAIYYAISRQLPIITERPILWGALYGVVVHLVMSRIVVPLSAVPKREFSAKAFLTQLVIHICFVGLPIALTVAHFSR
jgi:tetrahydromethanopterin S-methyltransferase subunit G